MRKKTGIIFLIVIIIAQICVPVGMVVHKNVSIHSACTKGEKYKFRLESFSYYDGHIDFRVEYPYVLYGNYATVEKGDDGYAEFLMYADRPKENNYIKSGYYGRFSFPVTEIETEKFENIDWIGLCSWDDLEDIYYEQDESIFCYNEAYLEAYVYKGTVVADSIYIDGVEINSYLQILNGHL